MMPLNYFLEARERISPYLKPTPLLQSHALQKLLGYKSSIYLKLESEQPTGSFKVRGAFNALLQVGRDVEKVVTYSSGNFAQAVAYAAAKLQKKATIAMPKSAPRTKIEGTKKFGADIVLCNSRHEDGEVVVRDLVEKQGYFPLHAFNDYQTIAGQGTIALEVLETKPQVKHFFSPVGGGGLLSGCASVLKANNPEIAAYSVEPEGASDFYNSFQAKKHLALESTNTIADGLRALSVGKLNYPILMATVDRVLTVSEESIIEAMRLLWVHHHLIIEPSGAVALSGFLKAHQSLQGDVAILVTGKNVDPDSFQKWVGNVERGFTS